MGQLHVHLLIIVKMVSYILKLNQPINCDLELEVTDEMKERYRST